MNREEIFKKVVDVASVKLAIDKNKINKDSYLIADLGGTSFQILELVCDLEDEFNCKFPDEAIKDIQTMDNLIDFLEKNSGKNQ